MLKKHQSGLPILKVRKGATRKEIYQAAKKAFTAADLQRFTEIEPMVSAYDVLAEMKEIESKAQARRNKRK